MTIAPPANAGSAHPLLDALFTRHGYADVTPDDLAAGAAAPGHRLLVFLEDPVRYKETLDLAVIVPEIARAFPGRFAVGVLRPEAARAVHPRYGFRRWPALVVLKDGAYVGAVDGLRNWDEYLTEMTRLLAAAPSRPPSVGVAVRGTEADGG
jgi:hydrogenase-1 operon protein HyaE